MLRDKIIKKLPSVIIFSLFLGISFTPAIGTSLTISTHKDLVNYNFELHGKNGIQYYTLTLSEEQIKKLELLINETNNELQKSKTIDEANIIFKNATLKMYKNGLFPEELNFNQIEKINPYNLKNVENLEFKSANSNQNYILKNGNRENFDCIVLGRTRRTAFSDNLEDVAFGWYDKWLSDGDTTYAPASGQLITFGTNGYIRWHGYFYGQLYKVSIWGPLYFRYLHVGLEGFYGFKWSRLIITIMIGAASHVALGSEPL